MNQFLPTLLGLSAIIPLCVAILAFIVLRQHTRSKTSLVSLTSSKTWNSDLLRPIRETLLTTTEPSLSSPRLPLNLDASVPNTEEHETYQTVGELLSELIKTVNVGFADKLELSRIEAFTKYVYQLQQETQLTIEQAEHMLSPLSSIVTGKKLYGKTVSAIEFIRPNARVEESTMWPLNSGLRVLQPYGVVIKSQSGEVLSRAKVRCR